LKHVKVDGLFIDRPTLNNPGRSDPELSISESVDNGTFRFLTNAEGVKQVWLNQFIFANAYLGADPVVPHVPIAKSTVVKKTVRKRRPRGSGKFPNVAVRLPPDLTARIDRCAKNTRHHEIRSRQGVCCRSA
jgi:hypothetical protein